MGCVGQDKYQQLLHDAASKAGLLLSYQVHTDSEERIQTGTCAVLLTGNNRLIKKQKRKRILIKMIFLFHRSLVADLGAAKYFTIDHLNDPKNQQFIEKAKIFYSAVNIFIH